MLLLSLTGPGVAPVTVAALGTTDGTQSAPAVVFLEQEYVHVSPGSSVPGELSPVLRDEGWRVVAVGILDSGRMRRGTGGRPGW